MRRELARMTFDAHALLGLGAHRWVGGLAEWSEATHTYLSVAFTWRLLEAVDRARFATSCGQTVHVGGPAIFTRRDLRDEFAALGCQIGGEYPDAVTHHHPLATIASRGCPVGCWFCIVPKMEGREFTLLPESGG